MCIRNSYYYYYYYYYYDDYYGDYYDDDDYYDYYHYHYHFSDPTRPAETSYAVFCLKKKHNLATPHSNISNK